MYRPSRSAFCSRISFRAALIVRAPRQTLSSSSTALFWRTTQPRVNLTKQSTFQPGIIHQPLQLQSSSSNVFIIAGLIGLAIAAAYSVQPTSLRSTPSEVLATMATSVPQGHVGNLTAEQSEKLRQFWKAIFQVAGLLQESESFGKDAVTHDDDKFGLTKQFQEILKTNSPESIRESVWGMIKCDHPDTLALRFLRARKWDVNKALVMLISALNWRDKEMHVDSDIMKNGEAGAAAEVPASDNAKNVGKDFMTQLRMGKSFIHGVDKEGRPICVVRVRLHRGGEQCAESIERYTVHIIETTRLVLSPEVETATIIFDMTSFSLANMDYAPVKFMIKCFEANYPESLGSVLIHNSPWIFQGIWRIIKGWLDPVVAAKVHFTSGRAGLEKFIEPSRLLKELGGDEDWEYKYVEPVEGENATMDDKAGAEAVLKARSSLVADMQAATLEWIHAADAATIGVAASKRQEIAGKFRENYWELDGHIRAKSILDRQGVIGEKGKITFYP